MANRKRNRQTSKTTDRNYISNISLQIGLIFLGGFFAYRLALFQMLGDINKIQKEGNLIFLFAVLFFIIYVICGNLKKHK